MLEFKNTSVSLPDGKQSVPFSLVVEDGDVVCLRGLPGSGKSLVLQAILGLSPISSGFITFDGELITPGSSSYFRKMIAYIPQNLPDDDITVGDFFRGIAGLHVNSKLKLSVKTLLEIWEKMGIDRSFLTETLGSIDYPFKQYLAMSFLFLINRKVLLVDNIDQSERMQSVLEYFASHGAGIIYTCNENTLKCNKIVTI